MVAAAVTFEFSEHTHSLLFQLKTQVHAVSPDHHVRPLGRVQLQGCKDRIGTGISHSLHSVFCRVPHKRIFLSVSLNGIAGIYAHEGLSCTCITKPQPTRYSIVKKYKQTKTLYNDYDIVL